MEWYQGHANSFKDEISEQPLGGYNINWWNARRKDMINKLLSRVEELRKKDLSEWDWDMTKWLPDCVR
jgi:hypothetical protein